MKNVLLSFTCLIGSTCAFAVDTATPSDNESGVTFIDAKSTNEVLRQYLLPPPELVDEEQMDAVLYEFMNQKVKWEEYD